MRIHVRLGGALKRYAGASGAESAIESPGPITIAEAMAKLGIEEQPEEVLVIVNDEVVPPGEQRRFELGDKDRLTLMPQLKGG